MRPRILTPGEWAAADDGAILRHDSALRAIRQLASERDAAIARAESADARLASGENRRPGFSLRRCCER